MKKGHYSAWGKTCALRKRKNQFAVKCPKKPSTATKPKRVNRLTTNDSDDDDWANTLSTNGDRQLKCRMLVVSHKVVFHVDSGATVNTLPVRFADKMEPIKRVLRMCNATEATALGSCRAVVTNPKNNKVY